jgi:transposase
MRHNIQIDELQVICSYNNGMTMINIAERMRVGLGVVRRVLKTNNIKGRERTHNTINDLWSKVDKLSDSKGCWIWNGSLNNKGYGQIRISGTLYFSHRLAYLLMKGEIPEGMHLCHKCDNPKCCNPEHLFIGSRSDNMVDCIKKRRRPGIKLNPEKVREIRLLKSNGISCRELSVLFGVSISTIQEIVQFKKWPHVI